VADSLGARWVVFRERGRAPHVRGELSFWPDKRGGRVLALVRAGGKRRCSTLKGGGIGRTRRKREEGRLLNSDPSPLPVQNGRGGIERSTSQKGDAASQGNEGISTSPGKKGGIISPRSSTAEVQSRRSKSSTLILWGGREGKVFHQHV